MNYLREKIISRDMQEELRYDLRNAYWKLPHRSATVRGYKSQSTEVVGKRALLAVVLAVLQAA